MIKGKINCCMTIEKYCFFCKHSKTSKSTPMDRTDVINLYTNSRRKTNSRPRGNVSMSRRSNRPQSKSETCRFQFSLCHNSTYFFTNPTSQCMHINHKVLAASSFKSSLTQGRRRISINNVYGYFKCNLYFNRNEKK